MRAMPSGLHARRCRRRLLLKMLDVMLLHMRLLGSGSRESKGSRSMAVLIMYAASA